MNLRTAFAAVLAAAAVTPAAAQASSITPPPSTTPSSPYVVQITDAWNRTANLDDIHVDVRVTRRIVMPYSGPVGTQKVVAEVENPNWGPTWPNNTVSRTVGSCTVVTATDGRGSCVVSLMQGMSAFMEPAEGWHVVATHIYGGAPADTDDAYAVTRP